jgi:cobalamin biosynthesis protein CbiG
MAGQLSEEVKVVSAITTTAGAAGTSAINGAILDTLGYAGVMGVITLGVIVSGAVTSIKWQQDTDPGMATAADLLGSGQTIADTADDTLVITDIFRPTKRYVRLVVSRGTQAATIGSANYLLYGGRNRPATQAAAIERFNSPAEGAA